MSIIADQMTNMMRVVCPLCGKASLVSPAEQSSDGSIELTCAECGGTSHIKAARAVAQGVNPLFRSS